MRTSKPRWRSPRRSPPGWPPRSRLSRSSWPRCRPRLRQPRRRWSPRSPHRRPASRGRLGGRHGPSPTRPACRPPRARTWPSPSGPRPRVARRTTCCSLGLVPVAIVEAKRQCKDVSGAIEQAKRYSRDYDFTGESRRPARRGAPVGLAYNVPFLFATNGRAFLRQIETKSGIWFLDARTEYEPSAAARGLVHPRRAAGPPRRAMHDKAKREARGRAVERPPLRDYQRAAIAAVEKRHRRGQAGHAGGRWRRAPARPAWRSVWSTGCSRPVGFGGSVPGGPHGPRRAGRSTPSRTSPSGEPAVPDRDLRREGLGDVKPEPDTRLHVATVQGMVKRVLYAVRRRTRPCPWTPTTASSWTSATAATPSTWRCPDTPSSASEREFRSEADYISKYRRVLDHFDAVRIGLTATPALHTDRDLRQPVFEYGYREAVVDGNLVDHEPPIRILTMLSQEGIHWASGEAVPVYNTAPGSSTFSIPPDDDRHRGRGLQPKVLTEHFNRVVCEFLAESIDPSLPGKTMIFCATDAHADLVVALLKTALTAAYGEVEDDAGDEDHRGHRPAPRRSSGRYQNERLPEDRRDGGPAHHRHRRAGDREPGVHPPRLEPHPVRPDAWVGRRACARTSARSSSASTTPWTCTPRWRPYSDMKPVVTRPSLTFAQLVGELLTDTAGRGARAVRRRRAPGQVPGQEAHA
jgi:type I restriction enzyme R subunit